jgi:hypothetical protein
MPQHFLGKRDRAGSSRSAAKVVIALILVHQIFIPLADAIQYSYGFPGIKGPTPPTSDCKLTPDTGYAVCETYDTEKLFTYTPKLLDTPSSTNKVVWTITNGTNVISLPASGASLSGTGDTTLKIKWKTFAAATGGPGDYTVTATFNGCGKSTTVKVEPIPTIGTITAVLLYPTFQTLTS